MHRRLLAGICLPALLLPGLRAVEPSAVISATDRHFFETRVEPVLSESCYKCHSHQADRIKGKLMLDSREGLLLGGNTGPAIVPGKPDDSLLIEAIRYADQDLQMPPPDHGGMLTTQQIADLTEWVRRGAPDPRVPAMTAGGKAYGGAGKAHWAFQAVVKPAVPAVADHSWGQSPVDDFILARLEAEGLHPNPTADKRTLLRRVTFDLIGLPPTEAEIQAFIADTSPGAYAKVVDRLLASPHYGERWARYWLDVTRYSDTKGDAPKRNDPRYPYAWTYRDYVIDAFNADKPYDRFVQEQIAGDELPDATAASVAATGFQRLGVFDDEPDDRLAAEFEALDDVLSTTGAAFLGLTLGCARCHDHKFDPIPQADYYSMLAFFRGVRPFESSRSSFDSAGFAPFAAPREVQAWQAGLSGQLEPLQHQLAAATGEKEKKQLTQEIQRLKENAPFEWTLAVREGGPKPPDTHILIRGNTATPGAAVEPAFLRILDPAKPSLPTPAADAPSSGRRLALARWITDPKNPLTARVMVNRVWQHHFGRGIVTTTTDFGRAGMPPTHPQLLDWLASEFIEHGWSVKHLHRVILRSATYRQSSRTENPDALAADPGNTLLWRQNLRRLEAEAIRDTILSVAGTLNRQMGGRGYFPHLGGEVLAGQSRPGLDWDVSTEAERHRRSVYTYVRRTMAIPLLENFDYNNTTSPQGERPTTTVAPQALMLLNDDFLHQQAEALAQRVTREVNDAGGASNATDAGPRLIQRAYQLALNRLPTARELDLAHRLWQRQATAFAALSTRLSFRPDIASALATDYFARLRTNEFLVGPTHGWNYHRGYWAPGYESIRVVDRQRAPFALWPGARFTNGRMEARIQLASSTEFASLLLRTQVSDDVAQGYEVRFDGREQRLSLVRHGKELVTVATAAAPLPVGTMIPVQIEADGARVRVWLNSHTQPVLDTVDPQPWLTAGNVGVRTWGGALEMEDLTLQLTDGGPGERVHVSPHHPDPAHRALQAVCLLILNLNEVVYVD